MSAHDEAFQGLTLQEQAAVSRYHTLLQQAQQEQAERAAAEQVDPLRILGETSASDQIQRAESRYTQTTVQDPLEGLQS